ncbi:MAG: UDP-3-O-(3-hydroxymyristoyl)glucosamine N-acyltransferase [Planctomycetota bacterium]
MDASASRLILVHDSGGTFGPLTDLRAASDLRCGLWTIGERLAHRASTDSRTVAHARLLSAGVLDGLAVGERRFRMDGTFLAARLPDGADDAAVRNAVEAPANEGERRFEADIASAPWDITTRIGKTLDEDLAGQPPTGAIKRALRPDEGQSFGTHPILIDPSATIGPLCVFDASKGAIVICKGATVRPLSVLVGPCVIGEDTIVSERALIKASTAIGSHCRVGGEIGGTIFQGYSNKSHDGHLGDSFVGEWVNIGAGSDNSNLLNTYGEVIVRLEADGGLLRTGRQFWGSVIGDHVKLAIGTRLMTGTTIGTGAMIACSKPPSTLVPRFAWLTDATDGPKSFRIDKFLETARAMMSRRHVEVTPAYESRIRALHAKATAAGA